MINNLCVACGQRTGHKKIQADGYSLLECTNCNTVHTKVNTISLKKINNSIYDESYIRGYLKRKEELSERFIKIIDYIEKYFQGGRLLDIGCGVGLFLELIKKRSHYVWELFGIDTNQQLIEYSVKNIKNISFINKNLSSVDFEKDTFDCITCFDVLEHDFRLAETLDQVKKILKKNGLLIVQCPNYKSVMRHLTGNNWDWLNLPDHIYHFNPNSLTQLLRKYGFNNINLTTWEPREDFVRNIKGALRKSLPLNHFFGVVPILLSVPLNIFWLMLRLVETVYPVGGLILIKAKKQ